MKGGVIQEAPCTRAFWGGSKYKALRGSTIGMFEEQGSRWGRILKLAPKILIFRLFPSRKPGAAVKRRCICGQSPQAVDLKMQKGAGHV